MFFVHGILPLAQSPRKPSLDCGSVGAVFIIFAWHSANIVMAIFGVLMIVKALMDLFVMIRNREVLSSAKSTINEIKQQKKDE